MTDMTTNPAKPEVAGATRAMFPTSATAPLMLRGLTVAYAPEDDAGAVVPDDAEDAELDADDTDQDEDGAGGDDPDADDGEDNSEPEDDFEEVEHEGAKYKLPKAAAAALKPALMKNADYTQKTQEVADQRRALAEQARTLESRQAEINQQVEAAQALRVDYGRVEALRSQVAQFENIDWATWMQQDNTAAQAGWMQLQQLKEAEAKASKELSQKEEGHLQKARETAASFQKQVGADLSDPVNGIPGWGRDVAMQLVDYAERELGLTQDELVQSDARAWKAVHRLKSVEAKLAAAEAELKAVKTQKQTTDRHKASQSTTPAKTVSNKGQFKAGIYDELPMDEWVRRERARLAKKAAG